MSNKRNLFFFSILLTWLFPPVISNFCDLNSAFECLQLILISECPFLSSFLRIWQNRSRAWRQLSHRTVPRPRLHPESYMVRWAKKRVNHCVVNEVTFL